MKALHPSDHEIKSARVPGGVDNSCSVCMDQVYTLPTEGRDILIKVVPNALFPAHAMRFDSADYPGQLQTAIFPNQALLGSTIEGVGEWSTVGNNGWDHTNELLAARTVKNAFERYRITSQSVTAELIAPALADQGTVTSFQMDSGYFKVPYVVLQYATAQSLGGTDQIAAQTYVIPNQSDTSYVLVPQAMNANFRDPIPNPARALTSTRAYTAKAKDGAYLPLRLHNFKWHDANERVAQDTSIAPKSAIDYTVPWYGDEQPSDLIADSYLHVTDTAGFKHSVLVSPGNSAPMASPTLKYSDAQMNGVFPTAKGNFGYIYFKGLAPTASIRIRVRQTLELIVDTSSTFASMVNLPPPLMSSHSRCTMRSPVA